MIPAFQLWCHNGLHVDYRSVFPIQILIAFSCTALCQVTVSAVLIGALQDVEEFVAESLFTAVTGSTDLDTRS